MMKNNIQTTLLILVLSLIIVQCSTKPHKVFKPKVVYNTNELVVTQIAENSFEHTSYKQTHDFGNVPCNGIIVCNKGEAIVFDTPTTDSTSESLITWIKDSLHCKITAIIPTHFHDDCLGGLKEFHRNKIVSYAYYKTIELAKENGFEVPINGFRDSLNLPVGDEHVVAKFLGEGHTKDNIVGYFASENVLFGGCLIKELKAGKGYLGDANLKEWSKTVEKVKKQYAHANVIVPGHGSYGNIKLLDYTIDMFKVEK